MKRIQMLQEKVKDFTIIKEVAFDHTNGHQYEVKDNTTGEVSIKNTFELTGQEFTSANGYKKKTDRVLKEDAKSRTHGMTRTRFYRIWKQMKSRCNNPSQQQYETYSKIGYDERWDTFENFYDDMFESYEEGLTIDRIDGSKPYGPGNCRWADRSMQQRNMKSNRKVEVCEGVEVKLIDLTDAYGMNNNTARSRLDNGHWELTRTLCIPTKKDPFNFGAMDEAAQIEWLNKSNKLLESIIEDAVNQLASMDEDPNIAYLKKQGIIVEIGEC